MTPSRSAKESRRSPREPHDSVLEILSAAPGAPDDSARLVDASAGGVSFTSTRVFVKGARIRGRTRSLGAGVREFSGTIVRVTRRTNRVVYAVEFDARAPAGG